ncbi:MAG: hypothetical protein OXM55_07365 [Bdellovibrionales bacterium]|nr:hypothetical protein [Bdellovibrionales bacterium]
MYSICKENHLLLHKKQKRKREGHTVYENRVITGPYQLWQFDIKYGRILLHRWSLLNFTERRKYMGP